MTAWHVILAGQVVSTLFMAGLIWFVQIVHYPLFGEVGPAQFPRYERLHQKWTTWVVAPVMLVELITAVLLPVFSPADVHPAWGWGGLLLVGVNWMSTWCLQVPAHRSLSQAFSRYQLQRLVATNWIRTCAWSLRGVLVVVLGVLAAG